MRDAEELLTTIFNISERNPEYIFEGLYRNLYNKDLFLRSYLRLAPNEGNMSKGVDGRTIDGFSISLIDDIIDELRLERYHPSPARRVYIKKANGKLRPLGVQTFKDKLVQEAVRALLESVYEPTFSDYSHGFRQNRSCHTALKQIQYSAKGSKWVIDCDISGFFDNISHDKLLEIIGRKIHDGRLLELIRRFLKAGYIEDCSFKESELGSPQGSTLSPLLANIYLNELDDFVLQRKEEWEKGTYNHPNPAYTKLKKQREKALKRGENREASQIFKQMQSIPCQDPMDGRFTRVKYARYADDTCFFIHGPKKLAQQILDEVREFLQSELGLEMNMDKTRIINLSDENARFLGYEIALIKNNGRRTVNKLGREVRSLNGNLTLLVPRDAIQRRISEFSKNGKPAVRTDMLNHSVQTIIQRFNSEIDGLYNYYCLASNVAERLWWFRNKHHYSLLATLARKERSSIKSILGKYSVEVPKNDGHGTFHTIGIQLHERKLVTYRAEGFRKRKFAPKEVSVSASISKELKDRILTDTCEVCGAKGNTEVHHVKNLTSAMRYYSNKEPPDWLKLMWLKRRRTLILCQRCHIDLHHGKLNVKDELLESPLQ